VQDWSRQLLANIDLAYFLEYTSHGQWQRAKHLDLLCRKLEAVERGEIKRLIVTMPPRHGKSEVISKHFPAWYLGLHPDREIILTSYAAEIAQDFSRIARDTFQEFSQELFDTSLSKDSSAVNRWGIAKHRGGLTAVGVMGPLTGRGGSVIIVDDPFKGEEDSHSPARRKKVINWYQSTLRTRLAPGGAIILIQTRWHKEDLAGYLIAEMEKADGEKWEILNLPAIAEENDVIGRAPGEALWPERFPLEALLKTKKAVHEYWWSCLYMQTPGDPEGGKFKRQYFRYYEKTDDGEYYVLHGPDGDHRVHTSNVTIFQTCDPATSTKESADFFVLGTWAITQNKELLLLDIIRERMESPDQPDLFENGFRRWKPVQQGVEVAGLGKSLYQTLIRTGLPIVDLQADKDKSRRATPMAARYKSGMVYHPQHAGEWVGIFEEELVAFPNGPHDDQVDVASYAFVMMQDIEKFPQSGDYAEGDCIG
jgi:predicted phage terminase large subunit-like protein